MSGTNACPAVGETFFELAEDLLGEVRTVFEVGEIVLAEIRSQPVKSKPDRITKSATDLAKVPGDKPVKNFINLFLR